MPLHNLHEIGSCPVDICVLAINEHVIVFSQRESLLFSIVPLSACKKGLNVSDAASYTSDIVPHEIFFLDGTTLCAYCEDWRKEPSTYSMIWIRATDPEFRRVPVIEERTMPPMCSDSIVERFFDLGIERSPNARMLLWTIDDDKNYRRTTYTITQNDATITECVPFVDEGENSDLEYLCKMKPNALVLSAPSMDPEWMVCFRTPVGLMNWTAHKESNNCLHEGRWLLTCHRSQRGCGPVRIWDAAKGSRVPAMSGIMNHLKSNFRTFTFQSTVWEIHETTIYKFTQHAAFLPLELLSAVETWKQLPSEKRNTLNVQGAYDFGQFIRACYVDMKT